MQKTAKIALMITGIFILALAVLPHHHHHENEQQAICFSLSLTGEADHGHHANDKEDGDCEHNHNDTDCGLRNIFVMSGRDNSEHCSCNAADIYSHHHNIAEHFFIELFLTDYIYSFLAPAKELDNKQILIKEPLRSVYTLSIRTLRAPPIFIA